jgi:hypothetical protein
MSCNTALCLWWGFVAVILILCLAAWQASGVELSIIGHGAGQGLQVLNFSGDNLSAVWNGTAWNITAVI